MKYIRTKDGFYGYIWKDCNIEKNSKNLWEGFFVKNNYIYEKIRHWEYDEKYSIEYRKIDKIIKQADTIEELIQDNDILYIHDLYPDAVLVVEGKIKPFGYQNAIELKKWLKYKTKFDLYIRDSKGNYIYVAKMNEDGKLCLI